jgi:hypothetical protein
MRALFGGRTGIGLLSARAATGADVQTGWPNPDRAGVTAYADWRNGAWA